MSPVKIQKVMNILRLSVIPNSRPASPTLQRQQETFSNPHESVSEYDQQLIIVEVVNNC